MLLRESQVQPLLLVFEDLHWIDSRPRPCSTAWSRACRLPGSCSWSTIARSTSTAGAARPTTRNCGWTRCRPASADEFLQALLGDDPSLEPLTQLSDRPHRGQSLLPGRERAHPGGDGGAGGRAGGLSPGTALPTIQVPATVQAVLAARIDRLPPEEKRLLQTAAVIGTEVPLPLLQAIAELPEDGAAPRPGAPPGGRVPVRDTPLPRAGIHLQACPDPRGGLRQPAPGAAARAARAGSSRPWKRCRRDRLAEQVERLAHHALRGEVWDKALTYCQQAGARANDRAAFREAVTSFEQALQALAHLPEPGDTRGRAIDLRLALGRR